MTKNGYVQPGDVSSPKRYWKLLTVIKSGSEGQGSVALGRWDDRPVLAMRWNGTSDNPLGNPQSRGLATWFVIPDDYIQAIIATFPTDKQALAKTFLAG